MKSKNNQPESGSRPPRLSPLMVEDKAAEKLKKRMRDLGLITNDGAGKGTKPAGNKNGGKN